MIFFEKAVLVIKETVFEGASRPWSLMPRLLMSSVAAASTCRSAEITEDSAPHIAVQLTKV